LVPKYYRSIKGIMEVFPPFRLAYTKTYRGSIVPR
jgi:hypothetical protein